MRKGALPRFLLLVFAWLFLSFIVWRVSAPFLVWPVTLLSHAFSAIFLSDLVNGVEQQGSAIIFLTSLRPAQATTTISASGLLTVEVDTLIYTFGLPLLAALTLAARQPRPMRTLGLAYAVLLPLETWSVVAQFLKDVAITAGPGVASQTGFSAWQREVIAFAYQFGALILPTVGPAVVWVLAHRRFLERLSGRFEPRPASRQV
jgi:hypothetical protein